MSVWQSNLHMFELSLCSALYWWKLNPGMEKYIFVQIYIKSYNIYIYLKWLRTLLGEDDSIITNFLAAAHCMRGLQL